MPQNVRLLNAKMIFERIAAQLGGFPFSGEQWAIAYDGQIENPALFPLVEASIDAAMKIEQASRS